VNIFTVTGNIGKDAEVRQLQNGGSVCSFPLAFTSGFGEKQKTTWARCSIFGKRAEGKLPQYLTKGGKITVSGEISLDNWTTQEGENRTDLSLFVKELELSGKSDNGNNNGNSNNNNNNGYGNNGNGNGNNGNNGNQNNQGYQQFDSSMGGFDDDVPF